jgi:uncharacterized protein HemX
MFSFENIDIFESISKNKNTAAPTNAESMLQNKENFVSAKISSPVWKLQEESQKTWKIYFISLLLVFSIIIKKWIYFIKQQQQQKKRESNRAKTFENISKHF